MSRVRHRNFFLSCSTSGCAFCYILNDIDFIESEFEEIVASHLLSAFIISNHELSAANCLCEAKTYWKSLITVMCVPYALIAIFLIFFFFLLLKAIFF